MDGWTDGQMVRWSDGQMDRQIGQIDRWADGRMDRCIDSWIDSLPRGRFIIFVIYLYDAQI
jgi:hypothetical protein